MKTIIKTLCPMALLSLGFSTEAQTKEEIKTVYYSGTAILKKKHLL